MCIEIWLISKNDVMYEIHTNSSMTLQIKKDHIYENEISTRPQLVLSSIIHELFFIN